MKSFLRRDGLIIAIYILLALGLTYPLVTHLDTHVPGHGIDDPALAWNLWWVKFSIFDLGTPPLYTDYLYYPLGVNMVADTSTFLNGVLSLPLQFLASTIVANNLVIYFALVVSAYGACLLAREVLARCGIHSDLGATIAGAFFGFGAWHINYVNAGHVMLLSSEWIPFFALYLVRADKATIKNGVMAGLFFGMTAWTELTFIPFVAVLIGAYVLFQLAVNARRLGRTRWHPLILNFSVLGLVAVIGVSPLLWNLFADSLRYGYYIAPGLGRAQVFSAEPISLFIPSAAHPLLGGWANALSNANTSYAFIGYAALSLAIVGFIFARRKHAGWFWTLTAMFFALVLLGPTLIINGENTNLPMPFALLRALPFVNANRYPVRYNTMLMLALVPLIALGTARWLKMPRGPLMVGGLCALLTFEQLALPVALTDLRAPAIIREIGSEPGDFSVLDLPLGWRDSVAILGTIDYTAQFLQTLHQKRLIGGLVSRHPAFKFQYFIETPVLNSIIALENGNAIDDNRRASDGIAAPHIQKFFNLRYIIVTRALTDDTVLNYVTDMFPASEIYRDETRIVYRVEQLPPLRAIDGNDETARLYFDDRWGRVQFADSIAYRWSTRDESLIWLPLEQRDQRIAFQMRGARNGQAVDVRVNGNAIVTLTLRDAWADYAVNIPASVLRDGLNEITFTTATLPVGAVRVQDDYAIGDTGVVAPVDIAATGAGFEAGRFGSIWVAGQTQFESRRGYHLVAVHPRTGAVERVAAFDTFDNANESARLAQYINDLPTGTIVAGVAIDDVSKNLLPPAIAALRSIGVESDLRFQFRAGHAFIGVKGAPPGQALEQIAGRFPANVSVGKNVASERVGFALGRIVIER